MRKVTQKAVQAFNNNFSFSQSNTKVKTSFGKTGLSKIDNNYKDNVHITILSLHDNNIAYKVNNDLYITNAGWQSNTTKERLNALPNVSIHQKNWQWYLNGKEWNGELTKVD